MIDKTITVKNKIIKIESATMKQGIAYYFRYQEEGYMAIKENTEITIFAVVDEEDFLV